MKYLAIYILLLLHTHALSAQSTSAVSPLELPGLVCFWDFQTSASGDLTSQGPFAYTLEERNGPIVRADSGIFGPGALRIRRGQWLRIKRADCPALDIHGPQEVSMVAWIKREADNPWQYIAGMWNERDAKRQYALFTCGHKMTNYRTMERVPAHNQVQGYVSDVGGATPGKPYCFSYATGKTKVERDAWMMIAYTYDQKMIKVYVNGELDVNGDYNPFVWNEPIYDGGKDGADFTVAEQAVPKWPGYPEVEEPTHGNGFGGTLGGLAIYRKALSGEDIQRLYQSTME